MNISDGDENLTTLIPTTTPSFHHNNILRLNNNSPLSILENSTIFKVVEVLRNSSSSGGGSSLKEQEIAVDVLLDEGFVFSNSFYVPPGFYGLLLVLMVSLFLFLPAAFVTCLFFVSRTKNSSVSNEDKRGEASCRRSLAILYMIRTIVSEVVWSVRNLDQSREKDLQNLGPEAALYLAFQAEIIRIITSFGVLALGILLPIHIIVGTMSHNTNLQSHDLLSSSSRLTESGESSSTSSIIGGEAKPNEHHFVADFTLTTIQSLPKRTPALWLHVILCYIFSFLFLLFIRRCRLLCDWMRMRATEIERAKHHEDSIASPSSTLISGSAKSGVSLKTGWEESAFVQKGIPPEISTNEHLLSLLANVYPKNQVRRVVIVFDVSSVQAIRRKKEKAEFKLAELRNQIVRFQFDCNARDKSFRSNGQMMMATSKSHHTRHSSQLQQQRGSNLEELNLADNNVDTNQNGEGEEEKIDDTSFLLSNESILSELENQSGAFEDCDTGGAVPKLHRFIWNTIIEPIWIRCPSRSSCRKPQFCLKAPATPKHDDDKEFRSPVPTSSEENEKILLQERHSAAYISDMLRKIQKLVWRIDFLKKEEAQVSQLPQKSAGRALIFFQSPIQAQDFISKERRALKVSLALSNLARLRPQSFQTQAQYLAALKEALNVESDAVIGNDEEEAYLVDRLNKTKEQIQSMQKWEVRLGPNPEDIIWESFHLDSTMFKFRYLLVNLTIFIFLFLVTTPMQIFAILSSGTSPQTRAAIRSTYSEFVASLRGVFPHLGDFLFGFLPQLLLVFCDVILLFVINHVAKHWEPHETISGRESTVLRKSFAFLLLNTLVLPSFALNSIASFFEHLLRNEKSSLAMLGKTFFTTNGISALSLLIVQTFVGGAFDLIRFSDWLDRMFRGYFVFRPWATATERYKVRTEQFEMDYGTEYATLVTFLTLCALFCIELPLILPFGLLYFFMKSLLDRFAIVYACKRYGFEKFSNILVGYSAVSLIWVTLLIFQASFLGFLVTDVCGPLLPSEVALENEQWTILGASSVLEDGISRREAINIRPCIDADLNPGSLTSRGTNLQLFLVVLLFNCTVLAALGSAFLNLEKLVLDTLQSIFVWIPAHIREICFKRVESKVNVEEPEQAEKLSSDVPVMPEQPANEVVTLQDVTDVIISQPSVTEKSDEEMKKKKPSRVAGVLKRFAIKVRVESDNKVGVPVWGTQLFVGAAGAALNFDDLTETGITHIVCLCPNKMPDNLPTPFQETIEYMVADIKDTIGEKLGLHIDGLLNFIDQAIDVANGKVLIHCWKGKSRSVAVAMAFIMHRQAGCTALEALEQVRKSRPKAQPNINFFLFLRSRETTSSS